MNVFTRKHTDRNNMIRRHRALSGDPLVRKVSNQGRAFDTAIIHGNAKVLGGMPDTWGDAKDDEDESEADFARSSFEDYREEVPTLPWEDLHEDVDVPEISKHTTTRALLDLYESRDAMQREITDAKKRATSALGFAALALVALGFTILSVAVRGFFH